MPYGGTIAKIPIGRSGLITDLPQSDMPGSALVSALNVDFFDGHPQKDRGSRRYNDSALPSGVASLFDYWPTTTLQRLIAVCKNGKVYRFPNSTTYAEVTAIGAAPSSLGVSGFVTMTQAGEEEPGNQKKLMILTGRDPIQVITADGVTRRNITTPTADWTGVTHPFAGLIYRGAFWCWGNDPHRIYKSDETDHEDFVSASAKQWSVWPGEGERIIAGMVYRGRLFLLKYPSGLYYLVDSDNDVDNWYWAKSLDTFGAISPNSIAPVIDDILVANQCNSITSVAAAFQFGDIATSDVFNVMKNKQFPINEIDPSYSKRFAVYYENRQEVLFTFKSNTGVHPDRICKLSFRDKANPKISWNTKDQPNCLILWRDGSSVKRPMYGAEDGYVYVMDRENRWVGTDDPAASTSEAYTFDIETPALDFHELNPLIADQQKNFDWLEVKYIPTGEIELSVDVVIDGVFSETLKFRLNDRASLNAFQLDATRLTYETEVSKQQPLKGSGRRISFRCYNAGLGENVRLVELRVGFQISGEQQTR